MKKRKLFIPPIAAFSVLILSAGAFMANYKPLVFKEEIPYYGEKIVAELRLNYDTYSLKVYRTTSFGIFKGKKTLLEKENVANDHHGVLCAENVKITGEGNSLKISIPLGHGYYRMIQCRIT